MYVFNLCATNTRPNIVFWTGAFHTLTWTKYRPLLHEGMWLNGFMWPTPLHNETIVPKPGVGSQPEFLVKILTNNRVQHFLTVFSN